jgi:hypothetical protein
VKEDVAENLLETLITPPLPPYLHLENKLWIEKGKKNGRHIFLTNIFRILFKHFI